MVFHTFGEEPLAQELKFPNDQMLQGYLRIDFPLRLFDGEVGYQLGAGLSTAEVLKYQLLVVLDGLELLVGMEIIPRIDSSPIFLCQLMGSASLSHYAHMSWGFWNCGLKVRKKGTAGDGGH